MTHKKITAEEGKVWQNKETKMIMGEDIYIGFIFPNGIKTQDTIENYEQVDKPIEEEKLSKDNK